MEYQTLGQRVKRTTKTVFRWIVGLGLVAGIIIISFLYWGVYDEGVWAGNVLRISKKGLVFKTYEGKLNIQTFGAQRGASPIMEALDFSVAPGDEDVIRDLQAVALSGERVNLHYIERYATFPWRGDTKYFIVRVERLKN